MSATLPVLARRLPLLLGWLLLCFAVAGIGAVASIEAQAYYHALARPAWAPPAWLFGPVWTCLYCAMAVAAWLASGAAAGGVRTRALVLFVAQLAANGLWSWVFFAWRQPGWALAELLLLWALIFATLLAFWRVRRAAALLLVPYLAWVSFAGALNFAIWRLNPGS